MYLRNEKELLAKIEKKALGGKVEANLKNIDDFINGNKKFDEVIEDYAKIYKKHVDSNKPWSWDELFPVGTAYLLLKKER